MEKLTGREIERTLLEKALVSKEAELIALYGRRRVGKTFLIRSVYKEQMAFEFTGIHEASFIDQLENFTISLQKAFKSPAPLAIPGSWLKAFNLLQQYLSNRKEKKKSVIFFDEFPWIHTPRSGFLQAFEHFWNTWASRQPGLIVVICGSAASWMIENIVRNRGGLHNRISQTIRLLPFTLGDTEKYLRGRGVNLDRYQLLQLYMAMGGIPQYLKAIQPGESAAQHIDRSFFTKDGVLKEEFKNLYQSLFANAQHHIAVVKALAKKNAGLTRNEIIEACGLSSGGTTTRLLEELEESGFITPYIPFDKNTKDSIYKLSDEYSIFYLKFIEGARATGAGTWLRLASGSSYSSWGGFAFESTCQKHIGELKQALGIAGVHTETSAWRNIPQEKTKGAQVDLLLDRKDHCINICEMKFSTSQYTIDKKYAAELGNKLKVFKATTKTKKTLFLTMVTTYGVKQNTYYTGLVQNEVTMDALFKQ
ncbi:MAG TPA: ATP-binding protein [Chitinophagaceae bacterium]|nr:ATP-binding protein [Chitinophagaceae bacterium]